VTIASFQAIQHRLADLYAAGEGARLLVYRAAWNRQNNMEGAANAPPWPSVPVGAGVFKTCREALQFHGGYGYTLDFDIQLYLRAPGPGRWAIGELRSEYQRLARSLSGKPGAIWFHRRRQSRGAPRTGRAWVAEKPARNKEEAKTPAQDRRHVFPTNSTVVSAPPAGWARAGRGIRRVRQAGGPGARHPRKSPARACARWLANQRLRC